MQLVMISSGEQGTGLALNVHREGQHEWKQKDLMEDEEAEEEEERGNMVDHDRMYMVCT